MGCSEYVFAGAGAGGALALGEEPLQHLRVRCLEPWLEVQAGVAGGRLRAAKSLATAGAHFLLARADPRATVGSTLIAVDQSQGKRTRERRDMPIKRLVNLLTKIGMIAGINPRVLHVVVVEKLCDNESPISLPGRPGPQRVAETARSDMELASGTSTPRFNLGQLLGQG